MDEHEKFLMEEIAYEIEWDMPVYEYKIPVLIKYLRGADTLKDCCQLILELARHDETTKWLTDTLNTHFLFAPVRNIEGVQAFRLQEYNAEGMREIMELARRLKDRQLIEMAHKNNTAEDEKE